MNKIVKILLIVLAVLLIAAGGFWGGTQFAYRQVAANPAPVNISSPPAANSLIEGSSSNSDRPSLDQQRGPGMMTPNSSNKNRANNSDFNRRQSGNYNVGPGMMARNTQDQGGGMIMNRPAQGFSGSTFGSTFMGGGMLLFGLLFPLGFAILMVLGIIVLFRMVRNPVPAPVINSSVCSKCGASVQSDWKLCPHCGEPI